MKTARILLLTPVLAFVPAGVAAAQDGALPGVDGRRLQTGVDSLAVYVVRGTDTVPTGFVRDELSAVTDANGASVLKRVYVTRDRFLGSRVDSIADRLEALSPLRQRSAGVREAVSLDFTPGRVTGTIRPADGEAAQVDVRLPGAVYNAASFDLVLRAADLRDGWQGKVRAFIASTGTLATLQASVRGSETIGGRPCWRVAASFAGTPVTFWIDHETRQLRQQEMRIAPDTWILFRAPSAPSSATRSS